MTLKLSAPRDGSNDNNHHISAKYTRRIGRHWLTATWNVAAALCSLGQWREGFSLTLAAWATAVQARGASCGNLFKAAKVR
jgi:hypothetical protein